MPIKIYCDWVCNIASKINGFQVDGSEFIPCVIILRRGCPESIVRHETVHYEQMLECLFVFWYLIYLFNYLINLIRYRDHKIAYKYILFEREAYNNQNNANYIGIRKRYNWLRGE
jgi:hypothetical protein